MQPQSTIQEMYRHYAPQIEKYFDAKRMGTVCLRTTGQTTDETLKKAYGRDAVLEFIEEILEDLRKDTN